MMLIRKTALLFCVMGLSIASTSCTEYRELQQDSREAAAAIQRDVGSAASVSCEFIQGVGGRRLSVNVTLRSTPSGDAQQLKAKITEIVQQHFRQHVDHVSVMVAAAAAQSGTARADAAASLVNAHDGSNDLDWAALTKAKAGAWADYTMTVKKPPRTPDGSPVRSFKIRYALVEKTDKQMTIETITTMADGDVIVQLKYVPAGPNAWRISAGKTKFGSQTGELTKEQIAASGGYATNDPKLLGTLVGKESITTPRGAFECRHYLKVTPLAMDRWVSDKVAPTGLVKVTIESMGIEALLTNTGEDAVATIPL